MDFEIFSKFSLSVIVTNNYFHLDGNSPTNYFKNMPLIYTTVMPNVRVWMKKKALRVSLIYLRLIRENTLRANGVRL